MKKQLSVIIPAYNEERHIARTLEEVAGYLKKKGYAFEIIVVNDGSKDGTAQAVLALDGVHPQVRLLHRSVNLGKGETVKEGIRHAAYPYCLFMDADNATSIAEWDRFEPLFEKGARVVVASRHLPDSKIVHPQPRIRRVFGAGYRFLSRVLFGLQSSDFNCGFKAYETALAKSVYERVRMRDWTFDTEVFCILKREGVAIEEVPVRWEHRDKPTPNIKPIAAALRTLASLLQLKTRY